MERNADQEAAIKKCQKRLVDKLSCNVNSLTLHLLIDGIISAEDEREIEMKQHDKRKMLILLELIKRKAGAWTSLLDFLNTNKYEYLAQELAKEVATSVEQGKEKTDRTSDGRKRTLWEVPFASRFFTGRQSLLDQLLKSFQSFALSVSSNVQQNQAESKITVLSACHGLGGVGKTQLAIEFVHRHKENFNDVFWFPAEDSNQIEIAYKKLAEEFKLNTEQSISKIVNDIKAWFGTNPGCLLIYDNASDSDVIEEYMPTHGCCVLVTSRNTTKWYRVGSEFAVEVFELDEATEYIEKILVDELENKQQVEELAKRLGCLPLALAQACAYMKEKEVTISNYLRIYDKENERLLSEEVLRRNEHEPVFLTWNITINVIQIESPFAAHLLKICSYFYSDEIPFFLLRPFTENAEINPTKKIFEDACGLLRKYSMIKVNKKKDTISLHRILQEVMRLQIKKQNKHEFFREALTAVLEEYPTGNSLADYRKQSSLIPHLESILQHMNQPSNDVLINSSHKEILEKIEFTEPRNDFTLEMKVLENLGRAFDNIGDYSEKRTYFERALVIKEKYYGPDHPQVATTLVNLGNLYGSLGDYTKVCEYIERALIIMERHYGPDHPEVTITLVNLGISYGSLGDYTKAHEYIDRARIITSHETYVPTDLFFNCIQSIAERHYGPDHPEVVTKLVNLGNLYGRLGDYTKQREYLDRALIINERLCG